MPTVTRELSIVYGSLTIGGASENLLTEKFRLTKGYRDGMLSCEFVVTGATEAAFAANCASVESEARKYRQRLQVVQGSQTFLDWNPSDNSGFDAEPSLEKAGGEDDTGRSRRYRLSVRVKLPADLSGYSGRQESTVAVAWSPARLRTVSISGTYTALDSNAADAQYDAAAETYCASILTALEGTYELVTESYNRNDTNKTLSFQRQYREIFLEQPGDGSEVVAQTLTVHRQLQGPGDTQIGGPHRLVATNVNYQASVDHDQATDLQSLWNGTLKNYVIQQATRQAELRNIAVMSLNVNYDEVNHTISASLQLLSSDKSNVLEVSLQTMVTIPDGLVPIAVWTGEIDRFALFHGPRRATKRETLTRIRVGNAILPKPDSWKSEQIIPGKAAWYRQSHTATAREYRIGIPGERQIDLVEEHTVTEWLWANPYATAAAPSASRSKVIITQGGR